MNNLLILLTVLGLSGLTMWSTSYTFVPSEADIKFKIKNMGFTVGGTFSGLEGAVQFNPEALEESQVYATVDVRTINTKVKKRDTHLLSADFFEVEKYPKITFQSTRFEVDQNGSFLVTGDFTIKQTTKSVTIPFNFEKTDFGDTFSGNFTINRQEFEVGGDGMMMGDVVKIFFKLPVLRS